VTSIALLSLLALVFAILVSGITHLNVGIVAGVLAWLVGHYAASLSVAEILRGFPIALAAMLFGITLLFGMAQQNGTLQLLTVRGIDALQGKRALLPLLFFALAVILSAIGAGNIAAVALLAPLAMAAAGQMGISAFLMTVMIANGANAGAFSPFAPTGIIANGLIAQFGIPMNAWSQVFLPSLLVQSVVALVSYLLFGGLALWRDTAPAYEPLAALTPPNPAQRTTLVALGAFIAGVLVFQLDAGFWAVSLAFLLTLLGAADEKAAWRIIPWETIMMVCGVSMLVAIVQETGGLELFSDLLASISSPTTITGVLALAAGLLSVYSSSSGVVMPTFIALVPGLLARLAGVSPVALITAINVGSHLVDVSPLSTLGALCIANAGAHEDKERLFNRLLVYGLVISVIGAGLCWLLFGVLWRG
jgi:Na+/H+ antiporter NhaD/arsenite permease-like protein